MRRRLSNLKLRHLLLVFVVTTGAVVALVSIGSAVVIPGGGPTKSDCYISMKLPNVTTALAPKPKNKELDCMDGDPACDSDGQCNNVCAMSAELCVLQPGILDCTPPTAGLKKVVFKSHPITFTFQPPAGLTSSACGSLLDLHLPVKVSNKGKKTPGVLKVTGNAVANKPTKPPKDGDTYILKCLPRVGPCPTTTTSTSTSTSTSTTTTLPPVCGDGVLGGNEQCDPPGQQGQCPANQFCGLDCQCAAQAACNCGAQAPTKVKFTTTVNQLTCGHVVDGSNANLLDLPCGTLWFGGGVVATSLPNTQPDMGVTFENVSACSGTIMGLTHTTSTDTGSSRNCTTAGCTFGAPLAVPNDAVPAVSTCVINKVAQDAKGYGDCSTGTINLNLPLDSRLHVGGGDLLIDDPNVPYTLGVQACPICVDDGGLKCKGGPNDGLPCTPETSALGAGYPTSQDCPPDPNLYIGSLSVPFALTTGTATKTAVARGTQTNAFCGFCRDPESTAFEGTPNGGPAGNPRICSSNIDCTVPPFTSCEQKDGGAFNKMTATMITETGTSGTDLRDDLSHDATLVSVFCLPPSFSPLADPAAGLPGPGATSLPGALQLVP